MVGKPRNRHERRLEAARGYLALDMPDHALRELRSIAERDECEFAWQQLRGEALRQKQEYHAALDAFHQALSEDDEDVSVLMGMAWCYKRIDELPRAIRVMERAYEVAPKEPIVLYNLSCYYALAGDKPQALSWLGRALRMEKSLRELIPGESDFDSLRDDPDFQFVAGAHDVTNAP